MPVPRRRVAGAAAASQPWADTVISSVGREAAQDGTHAALVLIQKTVQVEFRAANSDETREAEVARDLRDLRPHLLEQLRIRKGRLVVALRGEAAGGVGAVLRQGIRIGAEVLMSEVRIQHQCGRRARSEEHTSELQSPMY